MKKHTHLFATAILCILAVICMQTRTLAGNTWDGGGADNNWGTAGNWNPDGSPAPGSGNDLFFAGSTRLNSFNNYTAFDDWRNITFNVGAGSFNITGNAIDLFGKIENLSSNTQTVGFASIALNSATANEFNPVNGNLTVTSTNIFTNGNQLKVFGNNGFTLSFSSGTNIQQAGSVAINQNSTVIYNSAHSYTGDTFVNAGKLQFASGASATSSIIRIGDTSGTANAEVGLTVATGGQALTNTFVSRAGSSGVKSIDSQNTSGTNTLSGTIALDSSLTFKQAAGGTLAVSGGIDVKGNIATFSGAGDFNVSTAISNSTGSGRVTQNGTGILRFGAANTYTNETNINAGTIRVDVAPSGAGITSTYYVGNGGTPGTAAALLIGGGAGGTSGGITFGNPVSSNIGSSGNRVIGGSNTTGTNNFSGTVTLNDSNATLRAATGGTVAFNTISAAALQTVAIGGGGDNGTVQFGGISDNLNLAATVNSGTLVLNKTSSSTVHSVGGTLAINSGATAQLGGTGGDQIFNSGSITVNSGGAFDANDRSETVTNISIAGTGISSAGALVNNGTSASSLTATGTTTLAADSSIGVTNSGGSLTLSGNISGSFGLTKVGTGTLTLTGTNSHTTTTVSTGTLQIGNGSTTGSLGSGAVTNDGTLAFNRSNSMTVANDISGTGNVTQSGSGTTILTGTNSYGATTITAGTLQVGNGGGTGTLGTGAVTNNGSLIFNRASGAPNNFILTNAIGGSGTLTQNGGNFITISSANTYTGATTINSGRLRLEANDALGTSAAGTTVNSGGALLLAAVNYTTAEALTINGTGVSGSGALANVSGSSTYAGPITVATNATIRATGGLTLTGGVVKNGTTLTISGTGTVTVNTVGISGAAANSDLVVDGATLVVNAASNYNGPTTVQNAGTLVANAQIDTTNVTINSDSTLSGTGKIVSGTNLISVNGALVVGDSTLGAPVVSVLELNTSGAGSTALGSTMKLYLDLFTNAGDNTSNTAAADRLRLFGTATVNPLAELYVNDSTGVMSFAIGDKWSIADIAGASVSGLFSTSKIFGPTLASGQAWKVNSTGSIWELTIIAIPEPSRALLVFIGLAGLSIRRRRK